MWNAPDRWIHSFSCWQIERPVCEGRGRGSVRLTPEKQKDKLHEQSQNNTIAWGKVIKQNQLNEQTNVFQMDKDDNRV